MSKEYRYSEIFSSFQGEGHYCGVPTIWLRFWGCNLECKGFGQDNLDDPSTWVLPSDNFDVSSVSAVEDLPVWDKGCDSSYSWQKNFRHLVSKDTTTVITDKLTDMLTSVHNTTGAFRHEKSKQETHLAFTGGEPMMSQPAMVEIIQEFAKRDNLPNNVTVETNGTRPIKDELKELIWNFHMAESLGGLIKEKRGIPEWFWSVSPKLRTSGEKWDKAICPEVVAGYSDMSDKGQLKFVVDGSEQTWFEVDKAVAEFRAVDVDWPVHIMPVGATIESQQTAQTEAIVLETIARGYNVAARVHCYIFGNKIGT